MSSKIDEALDGFTMTATYIPQDLSQLEDSRGGIKRSDLNAIKLNWHVDVQFQHRTFYSGEYHQGIGHLPGYGKVMGRVVTTPGWERLKSSLREGREVRLGLLPTAAPKLAAPALKDVLSCLLLDSDVLDYASFEQWAVEFGFDPDSRKVEHIYNACLKTGLAMLNVVGHGRMAALREAFQDY
jgi:hypothetical protein